jgi:FixJ family two-component response regulator
MAKYNYSTIIVSPDDGSVDELVNVASALGESVAVVDSKESFLAIYGADTRCIILELALPDSSGLEIIRYLAKEGYRGSMVLTTKATEEVMRLAKKLANGYGIVVVDTLTKPFESNHLLQTLIAATDPAAVNSLRGETPEPAACAPRSTDYDDQKRNGTCH